MKQDTKYVIDKLSTFEAYSWDKSISCCRMFMPDNVPGVIPKVYRAVSIEIITYKMKI